MDNFQEYLIMRYGVTFGSGEGRASVSILGTTGTGRAYMSCGYGDKEARGMEGYTSYCLGMDKHGYSDNSGYGDNIYPGCNKPNGAGRMDGIGCGYGIDIHLS